MKKKQELTKEQKAKLSETRQEVISLLQSGYAGIDKNGDIVDRRNTKVLKALNENLSLNIPSPKKV